MSAHDNSARNAPTQLATRGIRVAGVRRGRADSAILEEDDDADAAWS
jgi:hypothetical protein